MVIMYDPKVYFIFTLIIVLGLIIKRILKNKI